MGRNYIWSGVLFILGAASVGLAVELDPDMINDIFGTGLDSARYGDLTSGQSGDGFQEKEITQLPVDDGCGDMISPSSLPAMMELHEELKVIQVVKAAQNLKCDHYKNRGYECVPYYQCDENGEIITDGYGLMDIRSGLSNQEPNFGILDSSDEMCPSSLDVCCKDREYITTTTAAPIKSTTPSGGGGYNGGSSNSGGGREDYYETSSEEEQNGGGGDYNGGYNPGDENSEEQTDGGNSGGGSAPCAYGQCKELEKQKFKPQCGRRNHYGLGVRIQGFKEGESQFGEWPHICAVLQLDEQADGYTTKEVKVFTGGASLIATGALLTAAHKVKAFVEVPEKLVVRCGEWDTQTTGEPLKHQDRVVKKVILHPEFDRRNLAYTSALLILEEEFELSQHIDTICLPDIDEDFQDDKECHVKGWGKDKWEDGEYQVILKSVQMPMVATDSCQAQLKTTKLGRRFRLHPSFVCAGGEEGKDACFGDGGGPLVCHNKYDSERYVQVGIVAWGIGCGNGVPGVYTSLSSIGCWIDYELKCNLGDNYELRYDATSCQSFQSNNSQGGGGYGTPPKCQVTWPPKSEYQRKIEDSDSIDDGLKEQTGPVKIEVGTGGGY